MHKYLNIQFVYEETKEAIIDYKFKTDRRNLKSEVAELPVDLQTDFQEAIIALDTELMAIYIDRIRTHNEYLATALDRMVDNFEYDRILSLIQSSNRQW